MPLLVGGWIHLAGVGWLDSSVGWSRLRSVVSGVVQSSPGCMLMTASLITTLDRNQLTHQLDGPTHLCEANIINEYLETK